MLERPVSTEPVSYMIDGSAGTDNPAQPRENLMPPAAVVAITPRGGGGRGGGGGGSGSGGAGCTPPIYVTLTAARKPFHYEASFAQLGLDIGAHPILVVKMGYLVPDLERMCDLNLMALTPGEQVVSATVVALAALFCSLAPSSVAFCCHCDDDIFARRQERYMRTW